MEHDRFGIYLNVKEGEVLRVNSPYWIPSGDDWVFLSPEVNMNLREIRALVKEKSLVNEPENVVWGDWSVVSRQS